jgi:cation transport ATPase
MRKLNFVFALITLFVFTNCVNAQKTAELKIKTSAQCGMCKERIEKQMSYESGIVSTSLDLVTKDLNVIYKPAKTNPDKVRIALTKIGYQADEFKADPLAYEALPACCKLPEEGKKTDHKGCQH